MHAKAFTRLFSVLIYVIHDDSFSFVPGSLFELVLVVYPISHCLWLLFVLCEP